MYLQGLLCFWSGSAALQWSRTVGCCKCVLDGSCFAARYVLGYITCLGTATTTYSVARLLDPASAAGVAAIVTEAPDALAMCSSGVSSPSIGVAAVLCAMMFQHGLTQGLLLMLCAVVHTVELGGCAVADTYEYTSGLGSDRTGVGIQVCVQPVLQLTPNFCLCRACAYMRVCSVSSSGCMLVTGSLFWTRSGALLLPKA
jgi:hypothetical protein